MTQSHSTTVMICETCGGTGVMAGRSSYTDDYPPTVRCTKCEGSGMVMQRITYEPHHPMRLDK